MKKIYFVLTYAGTALGHIIRIKTKKNYTHISIALDENLEKMYSFGRLNAYNAFIGGFLHEKVNEGTFKRFKNTTAMISYIEITDEQYKKIEEIIEDFEQNKKNYKFNIKGLVCILFNKEVVHRKNYLYCAEFVKYVLDSANLDIGLPDTPKPENFEHLPKSKNIYTGLLNRYNIPKNNQRNN